MLCLSQHTIHKSNVGEYTSTITYSHHSPFSLWLPLLFNHESDIAAASSKLETTFSGLADSSYTLFSPLPALIALISVELLPHQGEPLPTADRWAIWAENKLHVNWVWYYTSTRALSKQIYLLPPGWLCMVSKMKTAKCDMWNGRIYKRWMQVLTNGCSPYFSAKAPSV